MFGKIKWLTLLLPVLFLMTCTLDDDVESKKDPGSSTVTFNANGGSGSPPPAITGKIGSSISLPPQGSLSKENYKFVGWNMNMNATGKEDHTLSSNATFNLPKHDITLYATWIENWTDNFENLKTSFSESQTNILESTPNNAQTWNIQHGLDITRLLNAGYTKVEITLAFQGSSTGVLINSTLVTSIINGSSTIATDTCNQPAGWNPRDWHGHVLTTQVDIGNLSSALAVIFQATWGRVEIGSRAITITAKK